MLVMNFYYVFALLLLFFFCLEAELKTLFSLYFLRHTCGLFPLQINKKLKNKQTYFR